MYIKSSKKIPKDIPMSEYLKSKAEGFFVIRLYGTPYYIPITKEVKKLFHIKRRKNKFEFDNYKLERSLEDFIRDIISSVYLQIRDTIGSEIHQELNQQLTIGFKKMFNRLIEKKINQEFQKQLPYKKDINKDVNS